MSDLIYERAVDLVSPVERVFDFTSSRAGFEAQFPHRIKDYEGPEHWTLGSEFSMRWRWFGLWLPWAGRFEAFEPNNYFADVMVRGPFKRFRHTHLFENHGETTRYIDRIEFATGFGGIIDKLIGRRILDRLFKKRHALLERALSQPELELESAA